MENIGKWLNLWIQEIIAKFFKSIMDGIIVMLKAKGIHFMFPKVRKMLNAP